MSDPRPCSAAVAVQRVRALLTAPENAGACYVLGGGDYRPKWRNPWTEDHHGSYGGDCRVPFLWGYQLPADRPGYNHGSWATVADCINYNSLIEDSEHAQDLVVPVTDDPQEGDVLCYPTIRITTEEGGVSTIHTFIGHGAVVVGVSRWDGATFASLDIVQVCGPSGRMPAAIATDGSVFDRHSATWPKEAHRSKLLRVKP